jgi:hypothetical protein
MAKPIQMHPGPIGPSKYAVACKADSVFVKGDMVCIDATGYAVAASAATGLIAIGRCEKDVDNTGGANGALFVEVLRGVFKFANSGLTQADLMKTTAYIDGPLAVTATTTGRSVAGRVYGFDGTGVFIGLGPTL